MVEFKGVLPSIEIQSIDPRISPQHIDGIAVIEHKGSEHYYPFRSEDKGGKAENPPPHIWLWDNPDQRVGSLTLSPSIRKEEKGYTGSGDELYHIYIESGEVVTA